MSCRARGFKVAKALREQVAGVHARLFGLMARALAHNLVSRDELYDFRRWNKAGGSLKLASAGIAKTLLSEYEERSVALEGLLLTRGVELPTARSAQTDPAAKAHPKKRNGPTDRVAVEYLGGAPKQKTRVANDDALAEEIAVRTVVLAMRRGVTARAAIDAAGIPYSDSKKRWAQRVFRRAEETGAFHDRRLDRMHDGAVMTQPMKDLVFALWMEYRGARASGVLILIKKHIEVVRRQLANGVALGPEAYFSEAEIRAGVPLPDKKTIQRFLRTLPKPLRQVREGGTAEWHRQSRPTVPWVKASRPNEEWQADHTPIDLYVRVKRHGTWTKAIAYLTAVIDAYSRQIMGFVLSTRAPDAFTTMHLMRHAILAKQDAAWCAYGRPERLVLDNGPDFASLNVPRALEKVFPHVHYCRKHAPDEKPEVERWFKTVTEELLPTLPGYKYGASRGTWRRNGLR